MARWFEEPEQNPDWVTGQVATRPGHLVEPGRAQWHDGTVFGQQCDQRHDVEKDRIPFGLRRTPGFRANRRPALVGSRDYSSSMRRLNHVSRHGSSIGGTSKSEAVPGLRPERCVQALAREIRDDGSQSPSARRSQTAGGPIKHRHRGEVWFERPRS